jgi:addiction module RelB/DinJ family antitoxin
MTATALVQARLDPALKKRVETNLKKWGLDTTTYIRMAFSELDREQRIPFNIGNYIPRAEVAVSQDLNIANELAKAEEQLRTNKMGFVPAAAVLDEQAALTQKIKSRV